MFGRSDPNNPSDFVWKLPYDQGARISLRRAYEYVCPLTYTNWAVAGKTPGYIDDNQPDGADSSEWCISLWPKYEFAWNDLQCSRKTCFLCEKRPRQGCH